MGAAGASGAGGRSGGAGGDFGNAPIGGFGGTGGTDVPMEPPVDPDDCSGVSETAENMVQPVDIIIGVDTSGSMDAEIAFVQQNLNAFSQQIIESGVDVRVILLANYGATGMMAECVEVFPGICIPIGDDDDFGVCIGAPLGSGMCPEDANSPVYEHPNISVGSNDVLNVFINAYPQYRGFLRPGSLKTFVSVTDDDATDGPYNNADGFIAAVNALEPTDPSMWASWKYSSIYCFSNCEGVAAEEGLVHRDLVAKTSGVQGDLCLQDFGPVFDELATAVVDSVELACDWSISVPAGETFDAAKTNVDVILDGTTERLPRVTAAADCGTNAAWHYDQEASPTKVVACPSVCERIQAARQASVDIVFGCEGVVLVVD
jgi:hypothetical protein